MIRWTATRDRYGRFRVYFRTELSEMLEAELECQIFNMLLHQEDDEDVEGVSILFRVPGTVSDLQNRDDEELVVATGMQKLTFDRGRGSVGPCCVSGHWVGPPGDFVIEARESAWRHGVEELWPGGWFRVDEPPPLCEEE